MNDLSEMIIYTTEDGLTKVDVNLMVILYG